MGPHLFTSNNLKNWISAGTLMILVLFPHRGPEDRLLAAPKGEERVVSLLKEKCVDCHSGGAEKGPAEILDFRHLRSRDYVIPGDPGNSKLLRSMISGAMPQGDKPLPKDQIDLVREWIRSLPSNFGAGGGELLSDWEILAVIEADLKRLPSEAKPTTRYLTLAHFVSVGESAEKLASHRQALSKLVNSLSWGKQIVPPVAIDARQTVFRIDLRNYGWPVALWNKVADTDPYHIDYVSPHADAIRDATKTSRPLMRGDIFAKRASLPPFYHEFLQLPDTLQGLEKMLGIDVARNIREGKVVRAGFNKSGVSAFNRMVERHETDFGSFWISYDFGGAKDRQNLFAHPLGPNVPGTFEHDGGEVIFSLPNGLQAYLLVTSAGARIDEAPTKIVKAAFMPNGAVFNGLACMKCHSGGMIRKDDQIRTTVLENPDAFSREDLKKILTLYPERSVVDRVYEEDENRFQKSLALAIARFGDVTQAVKVDPVFEIVKQFEDDLDLDRAAAETGLSPVDFLARMKRIPDLRQRFAAFAQGTTLHREAWIEAYPRIVTDLALRHEVTRNSQGMSMAYIPPGEFVMGSPNTDADADPDEKPQSTVKIARAFRMGRCEVTVRQWRRFAEETGFDGSGAYRWDRRIRKFVFADNASWKVTGFEQSDDHPVTNISFDDAQAYCRWLSAKEGKTYRLPTEEEFEYCCRAGSTTRFFTGDDEQILANVSNLSDESLVPELPQAEQQNWNDNFPFTAPVAQFRPNPFGLFDMNGNVWEFCLATPSGANREIPVRGGGWFNPAKKARSAERMPIPATERSLRTGFRVVCEN